MPDALFIWLSCNYDRKTNLKNSLDREINTDFSLLLKNCV